MEHTDLLLRPPAPGPEKLYALLGEAARGYKLYLGLRAALQAGLFDLPNRPHGVCEMAEALGLDPGVLAPLCELLVHNGLLDERDGGYVPAAEMRRWLGRGASLDQRPVLENIAETCLLWERLPRALESGPLNPWKEGLFGGWFLPALAAESLAGEAQRSAALVAAAPGFERVRDLLDLGGGHGLYSLALCARCPDVRAQIMDLESAREEAMRWIGRFWAECADETGAPRVRFTAGNIFEHPLGRERDAVLLFYNPGGKNPALLERIHQCLRPGGLFVSKHAFYARDEGSKDPLADVEWNMTSFPGVSKGPHVYSFKGDACREDYMGLLRERFEVIAEHEAPAFVSPDLGRFGDRLDSRMLICRKR